MSLVWISIPVIFVLGYLLLQIWQLFWLMLPRDIVEPKEKWPKASVLLAARNEAANIARCLQALCELDYPDFEIIVGNDRSEDNTKEVVVDFIKGHPNCNIKVIDIVGKFPNTMAKAAVLAEMAHHANGAIFLITDADITVPVSWAKSLIKHYKDKDVGIVSGTTFTAGNGIWGKLQSIDWIYFMCLVETFYRAGIKTTAIGNNMSIRAEAYWETGGYENIPFSITEDYKIYQKVTALGWKAKNICNTEVLAIAQPIEGIKNLLHQRKRWLLGAKELPVNWWGLFILFAFYYPFSLILLWFFPYRMLGLMVLKFLLQNIFIVWSLKKLNLKLSSKWAYLFFYELYLYSVTLTTLFFFLMPIKTEWKGRKF